MLLTLMTALSFVPLPPEGVAPASCDVGEATPEQREALRDMDFLIGDYWVTGHVWQGEDWSPPRPGVAPARWNGRYGLGGESIVDEWWDEDPGIKPGTPAGTNVRMKKPDGDWVMSWVSSHAYGVQHLEAKIRPDGLVEMRQVYPERPGFVATFYRITPDQWARIHYQPAADGSYRPPILLMATRIPCEK